MKTLYNNLTKLRIKIKIGYCYKNFNLTVK